MDLSRLLVLLADYRISSSIVILLISSYYLLKRNRKKLILQNSVQIAKAKRHLRDTNLSKAYGLPEVSPETTERILYKTASQLKQGLESGDFTSEEILLVYIRRILQTQTYNMIADEMFEEALIQARECDKLRKEGKAQGALFGIPVSIKDCFIQKGQDCTLGLIAKCFSPASEDSLILELLRRSGAIVFVRTNVAQALSFFETTNNIYGQTENPYKLGRTAAGSSGGEAALISAGCSALGLANDIGGSLRVPAAVCGIYSFKPTARRGTCEGSALYDKDNSHERNCILESIGPMARSVDDLVMMMKALLDPVVFEKDKEIPELPWNEEKYINRNKLRIGYVDTANFEIPITIKLAIRQAAEALQMKGHEIEEVNLPVTDIGETFVGLLKGLEIYKKFKPLVDKEPTLPLSNSLETLLDLPKSVILAIAKFIELKGMRREANYLRHSSKSSAYEYFKLIEKRNMIKDTITDWLNSLSLDALILPALPCPAWLHGESKFLNISLYHMFLPNLINFPAGVVPISCLYGTQAYRGNPNDICTLAIERSLRNSDGLPVCVQVMTRSFEDELCLRVMKEIEEVVNFQERPDVLLS